MFRRVTSFLVPPIRRMVAVLVVVNIMVFALTGVFLDYSHRLYQERAEITVRNLNRLLSQSIAGDIERIDLGLKTVADEYMRQRNSGPMDQRAIADFLRRQKERLPMLDSLRIADVHGEVVHGSDLTLPAGISITDRDYYAALSTNPNLGLVLSQSVKGKISGKWVLVFARAIRLPDGRFDGVGYAPVTLEWFEKQLAAIETGPHGVAVLRGDASRNFDVLARSPSGDLMGQAKVSDRFRSMIAASPGGGSYVAPAGGDNVERFFSYQSVASYPLITLVGFSTDDVFANWWHEVFKLVALALGFFLMSGLGALTLLRSWRARTEADEQIRLLLNSAGAGIFGIDTLGICTFCNPTATRLLGYAGEVALLGQDIRKLILQENSQVITAMSQGCNGVHVEDEDFMRADGTCFPVEYWSYPQRQDQQVIGAVVTFSDISVRRQTESELLASETNSRILVAEKEAVLDNVLVGIAVLRNQIVIDCNRRLEEIFSCTAGALIGTSMSALFDGSDRFEAIWQRADQAFRNGKHYSETRQMSRPDGSLFWADLSVQAVDPQHPQDSSVWIFSDVTERKQAEKKVLFLALHDALTGLPNRALALERFRLEEAYALRCQTRIALLYLDLDNFKAINDSLGHQVGDLLLKEIATRIADCVRDTDTISRQGGDEFLIILSNIASPDDVNPVLTKMLSQVAAPFEYEGQELNTSVSIGIAIYPDDGNSFDLLAKMADMAMYRAKAAGRNTYRFYDVQMNTEAVEHLTVRNGLRKALEKNEFVLHYQPQIELVTGAVIGVEALIRWQHPELGLLPPARFIAAAEDSGLIVPMGEWVLHEACRQGVLWKNAGLPALVIAVNLSAAQFKRSDKAIEQTILGALEQSGHDPACLELEITESILIQNVESVLASVKRLKRLGIKLSIDDFGTGYSSLAYLKRFDVDKLKIDRSFITDLTTDPNDAVIVRAIIQMGQSLNLRIIAEGVENRETVELLRALHCDEMQGYFFARPMPASELAGYLSSLTG